jgi:dUTP pyrophosphatase
MKLNFSYNFKSNLYMLPLTNVIQYVVKDERAVTPSKAHKSDTGFDLTAISVFKRLPNGVILYDTGIAVKPPPNYYTEIIPRSSLSKTGWMLANSVGVIDYEYRGTLLIAMVRAVPDAPELELPFCRFQLVLRKLEPAIMMKVDELDETVRGSGGFGSTDNK